MKKKIWPFLMVAVLVVASVSFRLYPVLLSYFDRQARQEVYDQERSSIDKSVADKFPQLSDVLRGRIAEEAFKEKLKADKKEIGAKIAARADELKSFYKDDSGRIYLGGIDSYYWLRLLQNLLEKGHIGDRSVGGVEYDDLVGNPIDAATKKNIHLWLGVIFYKTASFFNKDVPLESALFFIPLVLTGIIAVISFSLAKRMGANDLGAFLASFSIALSDFFLQRSMGEWFDTDIYNVFFPLLVLWTFMVAVEKRSLIKGSLLVALAGLFLAFYASTWKGWWFIFDIMLFSGAFFILNQKLCQEEEKIEDAVLRRELVFLGLFFVFSTFFVIILNNIATWLDFVREPWHLVSIFNISPESQWPNVYLTVAELGKMRPADIVRSMGGDFLFLGSLVGLLYIFLFEKGLRDRRFGFGILSVIFWIGATFYASLAAMRFILLLVVPIGLAFGLTITKFYEIVDEYSRRHLKSGPAAVSRMGLVFLLSLYLVFRVASLHRNVSAIFPQMNDSWHNALTAVKKGTPGDALINSWWDFGHWFKAVAGRRVLFDGMTQNTPYAYWMARALLTDNEAECVGILRMINASDNKAAEEIVSQRGMTWAAGTAVIRKAVAMKEGDARSYLEKEIGEEGAGRLLPYLFPSKLPVVYLVISYDMLQKVGPISYIGNWDFRKVDLWFKRKHLSEPDFIAYCLKSYNLTRQEAQDGLLEMSLLKEEEAKSWFSEPWYYLFIPSLSHRDGSMLYFDSGLVVNEADDHAYVLSGRPENMGVPQSLIFMEEGALKEVPQKDPALSYSGLLVKEKDATKSFLLDPRLARSMLVRLYYFQGEGLQSFRLFHKEKDEKGDTIYVYEIRWPEQKSQVTSHRSPVKAKKRR